MRPSAAPFIALALTAAGCGSSGVAGVEVTAETNDGRTLRATYHQPNSEQIEPTLLLLHQAGSGHARSDWDLLWEALEDRGYGLLAPDLRSHGTSDNFGDPADLALDPEAYPTDIEIWIEFIGKRRDEGEPIDPERVGIVGLGTSGSLAADAVAEGFAQCAIAFSPTLAEVNRFLDGFQDDGDLGDFTETTLRADATLHDTIWLAGDQDEPSASDLSILQDATLGETDLILSPGVAYGFELLDLNDTNKEVVVEWCGDKL